jgi:hypothetical protein
LKNDPDKYLQRGGSCIIEPKGDYLLPSKFDTEEVLYCTPENFDVEIKEKMTLDVSGHYNRWDIFDLSINRKRKE